MAAIRRFLEQDIPCLPFYATHLGSARKCTAPDDPKPLPVGSRQ